MAVPRGGCVLEQLCPRGGYVRSESAQRIQGGRELEGEMTTSLSPVGLIKKSHTASWMDPPFLYQESLCLLPVHPVWRRVRCCAHRHIGGTLWEAQNKWLRLSGAWNSVRAGLGESQRNNNNDWNHKINSYWVYRVLGSAPSPSYLVSLSVLTITFWVKYAYYVHNTLKKLKNHNLDFLVRDTGGIQIHVFSLLLLTSLLYHLSGYCCTKTNF